MATTRDHSYEALASLNPAPVFLDSYRMKHLPENLDLYFGPPEEFFDSAYTAEEYTRGRLIPILDDGQFGFVTLLDPRTRELIQLLVESPREPCAIFRNWQQYLADLMIRIAETEDDEVRTRRMAELVGFKHLGALFEYFAQTRELIGEEYRKARQAFLSGIQAS